MFCFTAPEIKYEGKNPTTYAESTTAPTAAGTYTAKITDGDETATKDFEITKATRTDITASVTGYTYGETVSTPSVSLTTTTGLTITYYYNTSNSNQGGTAWSTLTAATLEPSNYYVYATITGDSNYNDYTTPASQFTVAGNTLGTVTATTPQAVAYDGENHGITSVTCETEGVTVSYGTAEGTYNSTTAPTFKDAGTHKIYYKVTKTGYKPKTGSVDVVINKKAVTANVTASNKTYDRSTLATVSATVSSSDIISGDTITISGLAGTFADTNVGTGKTVTVNATNKTISGRGSDNYDITLNASDVTADITAKDITTTITPNGGTYAGTITGATAVLNGLVSGDTVTPVITYTGNSYAGGTTVPSNAGTYTATVTTSGTDAANYKLTGTTTANFVINKASAKLSVTATYNKTYGDGTFALSATSISGATVTYSVKSGDAVTVEANGKVTIKKAGTATITATIAETANYASDSKDITVDVAKKNGTLNITNLTYEVIYGDADFNIGEITSEGDIDSAITFTGYDNKVVSVDADGKVTIVGAGETTVKVNRANGSNYVAATEVTVTVKVAPKNIADAEVILGSGLTENGKTQTQQIASVKVDGLDVTYEVKDNTGIKAGKYIMIIEGTGNFTGFVEIEFVIAPAPEKPAYTPDTTTATSVAVANAGEVVNITPAVKDNDFSATLDSTNLKDAIELTAFEKQCVVWVWAEVDNISTMVSPADANVIVENVKDATIGAYINIVLFKQVPGQKKTQIAETAAPVKFCITVPANIAAANREYAIVRVHNGVYKQITDFAQMKAGNIVEFTSDKFSTYAIIYKDAATAPVKAPKTGDNMTWFYMIMLLGAGLVLVGASRRKIK